MYCTRVNTRDKMITRITYAVSHIKERRDIVLQESVMFADALESTSRYIIHSSRWRLFSFVTLPYALLHYVSNCCQCYKFSLSFSFLCSFFWCYLIVSPYPFDIEQRFCLMWSILSPWHMADFSNVDIIPS